MQRLSPQPLAMPTDFPWGIRAQSLLAVGLAVLIAVAIWPAIPAVTAMSLVTLGATRMTLQRLRAEPAVFPLVLLHLTVYGALYGVFVAASLHALSLGGRNAHSFSLPWLGGPYGSYWLPAIDVTVSTLPIALALRQIFGAFREDSLTA